MIMNHDQEDSVLADRRQRSSTALIPFRLDDVAIGAHLRNVGIVTTTATRTTTDRGDDALLMITDAALVVTKIRTCQMTETLPEGEGEAATTTMMMIMIATATDDRVAAAEGTMMMMMATTEGIAVGTKTDHHQKLRLAIMTWDLGSRRDRSIGALSHQLSRHS